VAKNLVKLYISKFGDGVKEERTKWALPREMRRWKRKMQNIGLAREMIFAKP